MPTMTRVAVLSNLSHPGEASELRATREAARALGLAIEHFEAAEKEEIDMKKALVFAAFAASCLATSPLSQVSAQAPMGGFQRCLDAGNTRARCEAPRRPLHDRTLEA